MKTLIRFTGLCLVLAAVRSFAVEVDVTPAVPSKQVALVESESPFSFEFHVEQTYAGDGDVIREETVVRDFDMSDTKWQFVLTPRVKIGILRLGVQMERYSFGFSSDGPLPDVLGSTALVLGLDTQFSDAFLIRLELTPGYYGTDVDDWGRDTFNVPAVIGGTYIVSSSFQVFFGLGIDPLREYPILPGGGIRWRFAPQWTLNASVPVPRLEYEIGRTFMLYAGADIRATSYRVDKQFGTVRGDSSLNHAAITYKEIRVGGGFEWKISSAIKLAAEGGFIPYRNFDFHRTEVRYHQDDAVPYGMLAFHATF